MTKPGLPVFPSLSGYSRSHASCLRGHRPGHEPRPVSPQRSQQRDGNFPPDKICKASLIRNKPVEIHHPVLEPDRCIRNLTIESIWLVDRSQLNPFLTGCSGTDLIFDFLHWLTRESVRSYRYDLKGGAYQSHGCWLSISGKTNSKFQRFRNPRPVQNYTYFFDRATLGYETVTYLNIFVIAKQSWHPCGHFKPRYRS